MIATITSYNAFREILKFPEEGEFNPDSFQIDNITTLYSEPSIKLYHNIITEKEAEYLIEKAKLNLVDSQIIGGFNRTNIDFKKYIRNSSSALFTNETTDDIIISIRKRFASIVGYNENHIERLQLVHYKDQQYYKPHYDYFPKEEEKELCGSNREHTFLLYLNTIPKKNGGYINHYKKVYS